MENDELPNEFLSCPQLHSDTFALEELDSQQLLTDADALIQSSANMTDFKRDVAREKAGQRRDAYRRRLKAEWATLRRQDVDLSKELETLQRFKNKKETSSSPGDSLALSAWRAIAMRQFENRREAETLRRKLQAAVKSRAVMIQDLETVLRKRVREVEKVETPDVLEKKARLNVKDATLYNAYFENVDALYRKVEEAFHQVGVTPTPGGILSGEPTKKTEGGTEYFETIGVGRVPFSFQRTCDAVWELASVPHRQEGRRMFDEPPDPENSMAFQFCSPLRRDNGEVFNLRTYHVVRRYVEENRSVLVWRALSEADGEFPGMNSDETGWCIVHRSTSDPDDLAGPATTLVQACIRLVPMHFQDGSSEKEGKVEQFKELLFKTGVEDNHEIERMMERLLLDDALATDGLQIDMDGNLM